MQYSERRGFQAYKDLSAHRLCIQNVQIFAVLPLVQKGVGLLLASVPFHSILIFPGISVIKAIGVVVAPMWFLWIVTTLTARGTFKMPRTFFFFLLASLGLLIAILLSFFYAPPSPLFFPSTMTILSGIVMAVVIASVVHSEHELQKAYAALILGGTIAAFLAIAEFISPETVSRFLRQRIFIEGDVVRVTGPFRDPNYGALVLLTLCTLTLYRAQVCRRGGARLMFYASAVVQIVAVLLTFSRAAYITLGFLLLAIILRKQRRFLAWGVIVISVAVMTAFGLELMEKIVSRATTLIDFTRFLHSDFSVAVQIDLSLWYRLNVALGGLRMAGAYFPLGVGWENFRYRIPEFSTGLPQLGAHNTYIAAIAELGLPGTVALILFFWIQWRRVSTLSKHECKRLASLAEGLRFSLLVILICGLFLTVLHEAVVWAVAGLIMSAGWAKTLENAT